jgi:hypothetical protein
MADKKLLAGLAKLGVPLFEPYEAPNVNETLASVVKSDDMRLWEGFPVMVAKAVEIHAFEPEQIERRLKKQEHRKAFEGLMLFSGALFSLYHLSFPWWNTLKKTLPPEKKVFVRDCKTALARNQTILLYDGEIDSERAKGLFELYFEEKAEKDQRQKARLEELSIEYALAQIFSPKQKELFKKKLEGLPLTKTEQEYFSRTVKKKVLALANADLHALSKKLLGI